MLKNKSNLTRLSTAPKGTLTVGTIAPAQSVATGFEKLHALASHGKFEVLTVVFPVFYDDHFEAPADYFENGKYTRLAEHDIPKKLSSEHGFMFLDLLEAFRTTAQGNAALLQGDCAAEHPNALGHDVAAQEPAPGERLARTTCCRTCRRRLVGARLARI